VHPTDHLVRSMCMMGNLNTIMFLCDDGMGLKAAMQLPVGSSQSEVIKYLIWRIVGKVLLLPEMTTVMVVISYVIPRDVMKSIERKIISAEIDDLEIEMRVGLRL
jgi:hypothetical protein